MNSTEAMVEHGGNGEWDLNGRACSIVNMSGRRVDGGAQDANDGWVALDSSVWLLPPLV